jgi:hypothetical protein
LLAAGATDKFCFDRASAEKITVDLKYGAVQASQLAVCQKQYSTSRTINSGNQLIITGLQKDKVDLLDMSNEFKSHLINTTKDLKDCKESTPSRMTWFATGFGSAVLVLLLSLLLVK